MTRLLLQRSDVHRQRYREIARVFIRHGFGDLSQYLGADGQPGGAPPLRVRQGWPSPSRTELCTGGLEGWNLTFVKLGQALSASRPAGSTYIAELKKLGQRAPILDDIHEVMTQELGKRRRVFATLARSRWPSLAQVRGDVAQWRRSGRQVQRPNIVPTISTDLDILQELRSGPVVTRCRSVTMSS
jgi:ubiquinone biosynthesis protein